MLLLLLMMLFSSQQISASILHLYGQTLAAGSEGKPEQKTKKLFLGNEAEKLAPHEARRRLRKLVGQIFLRRVHVFAFWVEEMDLEQIN